MTAHLVKSGKARTVHLTQCDICKTTKHNAKQWELYFGGQEHSSNKTLKTPFIFAKIDDIDCSKNDAQLLWTYSWYKLLSDNHQKNKSSHQLSKFYVFI